MSVCWCAVPAVQLVAVSGLSDDANADLVLTFLLMMRVNWLLVGTASGGQGGCGWVPAVGDGAAGVAFRGVGFRR